MPVPAHFAKSIPWFQHIHPLYISNGSRSKVIGSSSAVCGHLCSPMSDGKGVHAVSEDDSFIVVGAECDFVDFYIQMMI